MMIDLHVVHATLQMPALVITYAVGILLLARAYVLFRGEIAELDGWLVFYLGVMILADGLKHQYWGIVWMIKALDHHEVASVWRNNPTWAIACNVIYIPSGVLAIARSGRMAFGSASLPATMGVVVGLICISLALTTTGG